MKKNRGKSKPCNVRIGDVTLGPYPSLRAAHANFIDDYREQYAPDIEITGLPASATIRGAMSRQNRWFGFVSVNHGGKMPLPVTLSFQPVTTNHNE